MLSLVIPCYNCASYIDAHIEKLIVFLSSHFPPFEVILVDDGSTDETADKLRAWGARDPRVRAFGLSQNLGKGAAIKAGMAEFRGAHVFFTDADLPYDLSAIAQFTQALTSGYDVVLGTRYKEEDTHIAGQTEHRTKLSRVFVFLANLALRESVPDTQAGIKGFTKDAAQKIFNRVHTAGFCFDVEAIAIAQQQGMRITSLPVQLVNQAESSVRVGRDGLRMCLDLVWIFFKYRLS